MRIKKYLVLYNAEMEDELSLEQFNYIYGEDSEHNKKTDALKNAKELAKKFNTKFDTNYQWHELYSIEIAFYNEDGDRID